MFRKLITLAFALLALFAVSITGTSASAATEKSPACSADVAYAQTSNEGGKGGQAELPCPTFTDVPEGSTFYTYVHCLVCRSIIGGYPDDTFRPNNNVTRGQLAKIVSMSAGWNNDPGQQIYEDVPPGSTFYDYVNRLAQFGYVSGYYCGGPGEPCSHNVYPYFRPNAPATRGQIAKIIAQASAWIDPTTQVFEDVPASNPFYPHINRMHYHNAVSGYPCGGPGEPCVAPANRPYFRPNALTTRGQVSKMVVSAFFAEDCLVPAR